MASGPNLFRCCELFPKIKDHIDYVDVGSPLTNKYYIAQPHGEIYGLDHTKERLDALNCAMLRPKTDIPGLFLTGETTRLLKRNREIIKR